MDRTSASASSTPMIDTRFYQLIEYLGKEGSSQYYWRLDRNTKEKRTFWFSALHPRPVEDTPGYGMPGYDWYYGVHPSKVEREPWQRAELEHIAAINCVFADFDVPNLAGKSDLLDAILHDLPLPPSVIVDSGSGYHCNWLLDASYVIDSHNKLDYARHLQRQWVEAVGGDPAAKDLARVLRIPGTPNNKYTPPLPVDIVEFDLGQVYSLGGIEKLLPAFHPQPQPTPGPAQAGALPVDDQTLWSTAFDGPQGAEILALYHGDLSAHNDDHSEADYHLCRHLAYYTGRNQPEMDRLFRQSKLYREKWERDDYRRRTLSRAAASCTSTYTWRSWQAPPPGLGGFVNGNGAGHASPPQASVSPPKSQPTAQKGPTPADYLDALKWMGYTFRMNACDDTVECNGRPLSDAQLALIRVDMISRGFTSRALLDDVYTAEAFRNLYHPVQEYLESLVWDGQDHLRELCEYVEDKHPPIQYADGREERVFYAFFKRWLIGACSKVFDGTQNMMLVLEGLQDKGKSHFVRWLAGDMQDYHLEESITPENKDDQIRLITKWIWEVAELGSTQRKNDREALKAFITKYNVDVRKPYGRYNIHKPAMASLIGTVNDETGFLNDPTGNRRYHIVGVRTLLWGYTDQLDPNQVWAQVMHLWRNEGESYRLTPEETEMRQQINAYYEQERPYESWVEKHFDIDPAQKLWFMTSADIIDHLVERGITDNRRSMQMQLAQTLRALQLERGREGGVRGSRGYFGIRIKQGPGGLRPP